MAGARGVGWPSGNGQKRYDATFCPCCGRVGRSGVCLFAGNARRQLAGRMLVGSSGVDSGAFRTGNVDASGWTKIEKAGATLSSMPVFLNDRANITMALYARNAGDAPPGQVRYGHYRLPATSRHLDPQPEYDPRA